MYHIFNYFTSYTKYQDVKERMQMFFGYARVSTKGQKGNTSLAYQEAIIRDLAEKEKKKAKFHTFPEKNMITEVISGAIPPIERPKFKYIYDNIKPGDYLLLAYIDRLGRDQREIIETITLLTKKGVHIKSVDMMDANVDDITEDDDLSMLLGIKALVAEAERRAIIRRARIGRAEAVKKAQAEGRRILGRPDKYTQEQIKEALYLINERGYSYRQASAKTGISKSVLGREVQKQRYVKELEDMGEELPAYMQRGSYSTKKYEVKHKVDENGNPIKKDTKPRTSNLNADAEAVMAQLKNLDPESRAHIIDMMKVD